MTIAKVNPPTWGLGDKLTSAQANQIDTNLTYALDNRSGQTATLASTCTVTGTVTCSGTGAMVFATGTTCTFNSGATLALPAGSSLTRAGTAALFVVDSKQFKKTSSTAFTATTGYADSDITLSFTCIAGDVLLIDATVVMILTGGTVPGRARLLVNDGGTDINPGCEAYSSPTTTYFASGHMTYRHVVVTTGSVTVRVQCAAYTGGGSDMSLNGANPTTGATDFGGASTLRVVQLRP